MFFELVKYFALLDKSFCMVLLEGDSLLKRCQSFFEVAKNMDDPSLGCPNSVVSGVNANGLVVGCDRLLIFPESRVGFPP